jgi:hypothetical protein
MHAAPLPRAPSVRLFISSFLGSLQLSLYLSIHGGLVNQWIWLRATSCVPADRELESCVFFTHPSQLTVDLRLIYL